MAEKLVKIEQDHQINITFNLVFLFLTITIIIGLVSFHEFFLISHNKFTAGYITLTTMFDAIEPSNVSINIINIMNFDFFELFSVLIIDGLTKIVIIGFIMASFINLFTSINIKSRLNMLNIKKLKNHIIICGFSMLGEELSNEFKLKKIPFVIIDKDPLKIEMLNDLNYLTVLGDFTEDGILIKAGVMNTKYIVFATKHDYYNLLGLIAVKNLNKNIKVISRATDHQTIKRLEDVLIGKYIIPEEAGGTEIGKKILSMLDKPGRK